jgi:hypothetical protein|tara:strand:+ start:292 stop:528 length:237 start_codon:yes stop_codon:yes gene_type:complete
VLFSFRLTPMVGLNTPQTLTRASCDLTICPPLPQSTDQRTHFLLSLSDGILQLLTAAFLHFCRLLALLLPATKQLLME